MNNLAELNEIRDYLPFLIPLMILQLGLMLTALVMVVKQENFRYMNRIAWILIVVFINLFGPILYFVLEKRS